MRYFLAFSFAIHLLVLGWTAGVGITDFHLSSPEITATIESMPLEKSRRASRPKPPTNSGTTSARQINTQQSDNTLKFAADKKPASTRQTAVLKLNNLKTIILSSLNYHIVYPPLARKYGWQGRVLIGFELSKELGITGTKVISSSRIPTLDSAALRTLARISTIPAIRAQFPVSSHYMELPIHYRLTEG